MKSKITWLLFLAVIAFAIGCNKEETTPQKRDKIKTETKTAAQGMEEYTFAQKDEFVQYMQSQMAVLDQDLDQLSAKIASSSEAIKTEAGPKLRALGSQMTLLKRRLDGVRNAPESTWESTSAGFRKAYQSSNDSFKQARQWIIERSRREPPEQGSEKI